MRTHQLSMNDPAGLGIFPLIARALMSLPSQPEAVERQDAAPSELPATPPERPRRWLDRLEHWLWKQEQRDIEAYLAKATDIYDLEERLRAIDRNGFRPHY